MNFIEIQNNPTTILLSEIPILNYEDFYSQVDELMQDKDNHCVNYYAVNQQDTFRFFCCIANDFTHRIAVFSHILLKNAIKPLKSITQKHYCFHIFEREIHENFGIKFDKHPWLKPVRYPFDRFDSTQVMDNYPFYEMDSEELHEVGVGPIHAGVIEPGHFRFICNGEKVLHLEIHLGYQHRGVEKLFLTKSKPLERTVLAESIAGDTVIGHSIAFSALIESISDIQVPERLKIERCIALELERIAVHIGDTAALCTDVAYQLGQVTCEALRTIVINTTQLWCGNRFGKGLIRIGGSNYTMSSEFIETMLNNLAEVERRYTEVANHIYELPSILSRFDGIGILTQRQAQLIGAVGMAARITGIRRDIRSSHPFQYYKKYQYEAIILDSGDVLARGLLRKCEVEKSIEVIKSLVEIHKALKGSKIEKPNYEPVLQANSFVLSLVEGWRGEICHSAITNEQGEIEHYKVKDASLHNWLALALAVRNQEISDFPICNKSFNLSYCGNDL